MTEERLLDAREVAALLGCSRQWVYLLAEGGEIPSYKIGALRRFRPSDVHEWLEQHREGQVVVA